MIKAADHMGLVHSIAQRYRWACGAALDYEDLAQLGLLGLLRAIKKFDPDREVKFSTYASYWIRAFISRGIADQRRLVRVPVHRLEKDDLPPEITACIADEWSQDTPRSAAMACSRDGLASRPPDNLGEAGDAERAYAAMRNDRTRTVVRLRLAGHDLEEIGKRLGLSHQRISQIEVEGIALARRKLLARPPREQGEPKKAWA